MTLEIHARRTCRVPVGVHPTLRLPDRPGAAEINVAHDRVWTYPVDISPTPMKFRVNQAFERLDRMRDRRGREVDASRLPFDEEVEAHLLLTGVDGHLTLSNRDDGYRVCVSWDAVQLPSLMLWMSNKGRAGAPFENRHLAVGVEPCCSAFDLGRDVSSLPNPVNRAGIATVQLIEPKRPLLINYGLSAERL